jgi:hypothetical protein
MSPSLRGEPFESSSGHRVRSVPLHRRAAAASGILEAFKKIWADSWGPRLEHILRHALLALIEQPTATLADVLRLLDDRGFRKLAMASVANPQVRDFWLSSPLIY